MIETKFKQIDEINCYECWQQIIRKISNKWNQGKEVGGTLDHVYMLYFTSWSTGHAGVRPSKGWLAFAVEDWLVRFTKRRLLDSQLLFGLCCWSAVSRFCHVFVSVSCAVCLFVVSCVYVACCPEIVRIKKHFAPST